MLFIIENQVLLTSGVLYGQVLMAVLSNALVKSCLPHNHFRGAHGRGVTELTLNEQ